ncbi:MAG: hypothetical protein IPM20_07765 [Gammaproteobacteria bacterium]|nr:hypothetical protein [Gammaproteobacteria bacterium]
MKINLIALSFLLPLFLVGCGSYNEAVQVNDSAYLLLIGNPDGNIVQIDNGVPVELGKDTTSFSLNGKQATKIQISTGKHAVKITKNGTVVVHREFYVSTGTSFELEL